MKKITKEIVLEEIGKFNFSTSGQVKFHEVDSFGVVHNIQYFYFLEWARTKYFEYIGMELNRNTYTRENPIMTVHHEMDYFTPLYFTDEYIVHTRTKLIKNSSLVMENIIQNINGDICVKASVTLVYMSNIDYKTTRIPDIYRDMIVKIEGNNIEVIEN